MFKPAHELVQAAKQSVREFSPAEIRQRLANPGPLLIDVREPEEFQAGYIEGALNIPRGMLEFKISNDPSLQEVVRPVIVYCKTSGRAALSVVALQSMGFTDVVSLAGGFDAWAAEGQPVVKPQAISFE